MKNYKMLNQIVSLLTNFEEHCKMFKRNIPYIIRE